MYLFPSAWLKQSWKSVCIKNLKPSNGDIHAKGEKRLTRCDDTAFQPYQNCVAQTRTVAHTQRYLIVSISTQCSYRNFDPRLEKQDPRHYSCHDSSVFIFPELRGFILLGTSVSPLPVYHVATGRVESRRIFHIAHAPNFCN